MPFQLTWNDRVVIFDYSGEITSQDIINSNRAVYGDERFDRLRWQLVCVDQVNSVSYMDNDVKLIAYMDKAAAKANQRITVAFAGDTNLLKDLYTAYEKYSEDENWPVIYFESREDALNYISDIEAGSVA